MCVGTFSCLILGVSVCASLTFDDGANNRVSVYVSVGSESTAAELLDEKNEALSASKRLEAKVKSLETKARLFQQKAQQQQQQSKAVVAPAAEEMAVAVAVTDAPVVVVPTVIPTAIPTLPQAAAASSSAPSIPAPSAPLRSTVMVPLMNAGVNKQLATILAKRKEVTDENAGPAGSTTSTGTTTFRLDTMAVTVPVKPGALLSTSTSATDPDKKPRLVAPTAAPLATLQVNRR
jgi:hypothetical protein